MHRSCRKRADPEDHQREFTSDELSEIIRLAARHQTNKPKNKVSYEEMLSVGRELGIDTSLLEDAASEVSVMRRARQKRIRRKMRFLHHLSVYASVVIGLFLINMITSPSFLWSLIPAAGWGIGLAIHFFSVYLVEREAMTHELA